MSALTAGICPNCNEYILLKKGVPFLICPLCGENLSARQAMATLEVICADARKLNENIAHCLKLEEKYGPELPLQILSVIEKFFPHNEEVAFLVVKMAGYGSYAVRGYLTNFASVKTPVPFAEEFMQKSLTFRNLGFADLFTQYINNKFTGKQQFVWKERIKEALASYKPKEHGKGATTLLFLYYILFAVVNIALSGFFILVNLNILFYIVITIGVLFIEIAFIYFHNRKYGDRLQISDAERALMVTFMCSMVIAVGGIFLGALISI